MQLLSVRACDYILHACRKEKNLAHALQLGAYLWVSGLCKHFRLGNLLVSTFVEAGCTYHAQKVFDGLSQPDECSLNALIIGYAKAVKLDIAFGLYQKMHFEGLKLSGHALVALLKACSMLKDVGKGHVLHADIIDMGLVPDNFVGSALIDMYANLGSLKEAKSIFAQLQSRDSVAWSTFIAANVRQGHEKEALMSFEQMQLQGVFPTTAAFVSVLKACGIARDYKKGLLLHNDIAKFGLIESDHGVGNSLVDMYSTFGLLEMAQKVFDMLEVRDKFAWTALITGYSSQGLHTAAIRLFDCMQANGITPDVVTFSCGLAACSGLGDGVKSQVIHGEVARRGFLQVDPVVGNALVDAYANSGLLVIATEVFDSLLVRDVVAWTSLMAGLAKNGYDSDALNRFQEMLLEGIVPNSYTYVCVLQACGNIGEADKGQEIHAEVARLGLIHSELLIPNALVDMYASCGLLLKARELFDQCSVCDTVSWNVLISGYAKHDCNQDVLYLFKCMQRSKISLNEVTYIHVLKACTLLGTLGEGQELHAEIARASMHKDTDVGNALLDMYSCCGLLLNSVEVFKSLLQRDAVSWTLLIKSYVMYGCIDDAFNSFLEMKKEGISPTAVAFAYILKMCGSSLLADKAQEIHDEILSSYYSEYDIVVKNTLIDMYAKCGLHEKAQTVFDDVPAEDKDTVTWNALILGLSQAGEYHKTIDLFYNMSKEEQDPDMLTFLGLLNACSHAGLVDLAFLCFRAMGDVYDILANLEHFSCILDLLGRAGQLVKAVATIESMPYHPNLVAYHTLLTAFRQGRQMDVGWQIFAHAIEMDGENIGTYVTMLNMCALCLEDQHEKS